MGLLLILFLFAMFVIGIATGFWQAAKFIYKVIVDPRPLYTPSPIKPMNLAPRPVPAPPAAEVPKRVVLNRAQTLQVLEAEVRRAIRAQALNLAARQELFAYIDQERTRIPGAKLAETTCPAAEPASAPALEIPTYEPSGEPPPLPDSARPEVPELCAPVLQETAAAEPEALSPKAEPATSAAKFDEPVASKSREPEAIRAMIAKLHADAQPPEVPAPASSETEAACAAPSQPPAKEDPTAPALEEARAEMDVAERMTPASYHLEPVKILEVPAQEAQPAVMAEAAGASPKHARTFKPYAKTAPQTVPKKTLAERLFTPENVRILQSIGIGIIFISAVAFVRMNMWEGASAWQQLVLLLGGTTACMGAGFALRRWTSLRITGLGFLILGQLAIVLDTYAALVNQGAGHPPMYPWAPSSLWMISMLVFSASAWWNARRLNEPLFEAFTFFGALAAYGSGAVYAGVAGAAGERWWMMPAAYVPALVCCGIIATLMHARAVASGAHDANDLRAKADGWRRWTLWWWMDATWKVGASLVTVLVPAAAIFSGRADLSAQFGWHAAAILGLGTGLTLEGLRRGRLGAAAAGAVNLLAIAPLYAFAHAWPLAQYALALALPGTALAFAAIVLRRLPGESVLRTPVCSVQKYMGGAATALGATWAFWAWQFANLSDVHAAWCAGSLLALGLAIAVVEGEAWGAWAGTAGVGFLLAIALEALRLDLMWWPAAGLGTALSLHLLWQCVRGKEEVAASGHMAANYLAGTAMLQLFYFSMRVLPGVAGVTFGLAGSWVVLALYLFAIAYLNADWRPVALGAGVAVLGPATAMSLYAHGHPLCAPSPWLMLLALAAQVVAWILCRESNEDQSKSGSNVLLRDALCVGAGVILVLGVLLAIVQASLGEAGAAALAFALAIPAVAGLSLRLRQRPRADQAWVALAELATFGCYSAAGVEAARWFGLGEMLWPLAASFLGAGALFASLLGEALAFRRNAQGETFDDAPFRATGAITAFLWTGVAGLHLLMNLSMPDRALLLQSTWAAALVPLFVALRPSADPKEKDVFTWQSLLGAGIASILVFFAGVLALSAQFWTSACPAQLREACAVYFAVVFAASVAAGVVQRRAYAPITSALALLGLLGCAYGGWALPVESFGLACVLVAAAFGALGAWLERTQPQHPGQAYAASLAAALTGSMGCLHLLAGLAIWPVGTAHAWGVAAWTLLAAGAGIGSQVLLPRRKGHQPSALACAGSAAAVLALCHALRWTSVDFTAFGPYLAGSALALLALRELARAADRNVLACLHEAEASEEPQALDPQEAAANLTEAMKPRVLVGRGGGVMASALMTGCMALILGLVGWWDGLTTQWMITLFIEAFGLGALAVVTRRDHEKPFGPLLLLIELGAWFFLAGGMLLGMYLYDNALLLTSPMLVLGGAIFFALGMAGESLTGMLLQPERHATTPRPFLESRHIAALGMAGLGVFASLGRHDAFADPTIHTTWRAVLCAGFLFAYAGMAEWSAEDLARRAGRMAAGLISHLLLIPGGYLCLLKAHSTGSSWGALWFLALAPLQLLAANLLDREKHSVQAMLARCGALLVSLGALALAFFGNAQRLSEVPCATFAALLALALVARWACKGPERQAYGLGALLALTGTAFFAVRIFAHDPAFGFTEMSVWEWPVLAGLGLLLMLAGGATEWECDPKGRSMAGLYGGLLSFLATGVALYMLAAHGMAAHYLHVANIARFEAFVVSLLLASGANLAVKRYLGIRECGYIAPILALAGYGLYIWTMHPGAWEWYTVPAAVLLFVWAKSRASEDEAGALPAVQQEVAILLGMACAAALVPSFAQALPYEPEALFHYYALVTAGLTLVGGAMFARRKIPLLSGSAAVLLGTLVKTAQWAAHKEVIYPVMGIALGFGVLAVGCLFESRMNRAIRQTVDRVRAEARMFWVSWE